jgi:DNA helicase-2/ATP-dependent DNA helicase PcrA
MFEKNPQSIDKSNSQNNFLVNDHSNPISFEQLTKSLNDQQLEAVRTTEGPLLVLAGAGTGKTKVLTTRIIHLINSQLAYPSQILAVTFTNKAASEMKKRIGEIIGDQVNNIWVGTFHSICARILRRNPEAVGLRSDFTIIDDDDQNRLLKQIINDLNIDPKQFPAKLYLNKISRLKDSLKNPSLNDDLGLPKLKDVFEIYQSRLRSMNSVDFGDLIALNLEVFNRDLEVLSYYQNKFRYVLIDEYQDTNNAQYQWLLKLSALNCNICCVGDDDQSIYSWRGANIANILRFEKDFTDAKVIRLEQNYRSTSRILNSADSVISNNKERHGKTLWTDLGKGDKIQVFAYNDDRLEALITSNKIKDAIANKKIKPNEIAVLVRAGHQTRAFEEAFIQNNLPYRIIGGTKFYERMEVRDSIAYLRICANFDDDLAMSRIINVPKRGVGETALANLYQQSKDQKISLFKVIKNAISNNDLKGKSRESLSQLITILEKFNQQISPNNLEINDSDISDSNFQNLNSKDLSSDLSSINLAQIAKNLLHEVNYWQMWESENTQESQGRIANIEEFINSLSDFSNITEFMEYVALVEAKDDKNLQDTVCVMTVHGAKGLEFDMVFLPGLEDGIFPSSRSVQEKNGVEEERRLMYVAITRAKKHLIISFAKSRYLFGDVVNSMPSRFIRELPENEIEFEEVNFSNNYWQKNNNDFGNDFGNDFSDNDFEEQEFNTKKYPVRNNFKTNNFQNNYSASSAKFQTNFSKKPVFNSSQSLVNSISNQDDSMLNKRVFHQKFGYGKVINVDGKKLEIIFEKAGTKIVMQDFVIQS